MTAQAAEACASHALSLPHFLAHGKLPSSNAVACWHDGGVRHFDLCIIGTGSGNSIIDDRFDQLSVALA